jgi:nucleoside-diphosphate-sugar epimerase
VAVSTTSRYTKKESSSEEERIFVSEIVAGEEALIEWAQANEASWTLLRPTMIYGFGMDKNVCVIANFIHRFHFFTTLGKASGLRQPIHARDVAAACHAALQRDAAANQSYNLSGAEIISYREMVNRIFHVLGKRPRFVQIPLWMFSVAVSIVRILPRFRSWSSAMAERMNQDMAFDHDAAARDLGFTPQGFSLEKEDLPPACR